MARDGSAVTTRCAVRLPAQAAEKAALDAYLRAHEGWQTTTFAPKDDDELNIALAEGQFETVLFASLPNLLECVWKGHAEPDRWASAGVRIELATPPDSAETWRTHFQAVYASLAEWRRQERRRQIIAACILSATALIAVGVFLFTLG